MMLNTEQIKSITTGAVRIEKENGKFRFYRFTREQTALYEKGGIREDESFSDRCRATAGVKMRFKTDSKTLKIAGEVARCTSRTYYSFDILVNGTLVDAIDNFTGASMPRNCPTAEMPLGQFSKELTLGEGEKEICIYLPWSVCPMIEELSLDDGAYIQPVKQKKTMLVFGDSITQGYDAMRCSLRYSARLAEKLGADEVNKGIGGEQFFPAMAQHKDDLTPDYITVAYGTNDWSKGTEESFKVRCKAFYEALSNHYPTAKIFAITPIWRKDYQGERVFGPFENVEADIREAVSGLANVTVIRGFDFVPKSETYFSDLRLHPTDEGFVHYAENLYNAIVKTL